MSEIDDLELDLKVPPHDAKSAASGRNAKKGLKKAVFKGQRRNHIKGHYTAKNRADAGLKKFD